MFSNKKNRQNWFDIQDPRNSGLYIQLLTLSLIPLAFLARLSLFRFRENDFVVFAEWFNYLRNHGASGLADDFSVYNTPILLLFYLVGLLPVGVTAGLKGLTFAADLFMAFSIFLLLKHFYGEKSKKIPVLGAIGSLYLPVVLTTGAWWGQYDQLFMAFVFFSLYFLLKDKSKLSWLFFGIAFAVKLQAIFFLPVLILMSFRRIKIWHSIFAVAAFGILSFFPLLLGGSVQTIANIYLRQLKLGHGYLTIFIPNIYKWVTQGAWPNNSGFDYLKNFGIFISFALMVGLLIFNLYRKKYSDKDVVLLSTLVMLTLPMFLPEMHERYMFPVTVMSYILVFAIPKKSFFWIALILELTTVMSYAQYLSNWELQEPPISWSLLALANTAALIWLTFEYVGPVRKNEIFKQSSYETSL